MISRCGASLQQLVTLFLLASCATSHAFDVASLPDVRFFVAGGASAALSHGISTPIDVVKTRIQAAPNVYNGGLRDSALKILDEDGPGALLLGLGPTVVGYGAEGALKFGAYESLKPVMLAAFATTDPTEPYLAAAACAGGLASLVLCPMEEVRIRLVTDPEFADGLLDGLPRLLREEGLLSTFAGIWAMLSKQVPYTMAKQVSFDVTAAFLYSAALGYSWIPESTVKSGVPLGAAALAAILACTASHPGDVILTATYKKGDNGGFVDNIRNIYKNDGLRGFLSGIDARLIHVGIIITSQLVVYDTIKQLLGLPASGT